jgi:peptide-methionine (R)-S-oxide reductase
MLQTHRFSLLLLVALVFGGLVAVPSSGQTASAPKAGAKAPAATKVGKVTKTKAEWKKQLSNEEYQVLFEQGTERSFTGKYWDHHEKGTYVCNACKLPLFASATKFESGTGWPSFYQPISKEAVGENIDRSFGSVRTEVHCNRCGGHLGHVFDDGPAPTGLRYCINSVSLDFKDK